MKHIKTFNEAINEGFLSWIFNKGIIYKIEYTVEFNNKNDNLTYKSYLTIKAKDEDDAEEKFYEKWNTAIKKLASNPTVIIGHIKKTNKADKINIEFPKSITNPKEVKDIKYIKKKSNNK